MTQEIRYRIGEEADFDSLLKMSEKLWTKAEKAKLHDQLRASYDSNNKIVFVALNEKYEAVGFAIFSIRTDYVEGAKHSPTGYLEGIFIESDYRKLGIAKDFIESGERWCKEMGCTQLGSDTWLTATESRKFHKKLGFREEEELVHFLKDI